MRLWKANPPKTRTARRVSFEHPTISLIETGLKPGFDLYIGGTDAARDIGLLRQHGIALVVNCAVNLDINYVLDPREPEEDEKCAHGAGPIRTYKIGLVDGPGNSEHMMLGGFLLLDGAIRQELPIKHTYPNRERGNILVQFAGAAAVAPRRLSRFICTCALRRNTRHWTSAVAHVREKRSLHPDEWVQRAQTDTDRRRPPCGGCGSPAGHTGALGQPGTGSARERRLTLWSKSTPQSNKRNPSAGTRKWASKPLKILSILMQLELPI